MRQGHDHSGRKRSETSPWRPGPTKKRSVSPLSQKDEAKLMVEGCGKRPICRNATSGQEGSQAERGDSGRRDGLAAMESGPEEAKRQRGPQGDWEGKWQKATARTPTLPPPAVLTKKRGTGRVSRAGKRSQGCGKALQRPPSNAERPRGGGKRRTDNTSESVATKNEGQAAREGGLHKRKRGVPPTAHRTTNQQGDEPPQRQPSGTTQEQQAHQTPRARKNTGYIGETGRLREWKEKSA